MTDEKRYYWLKLKDDFFAQKEIKKLRRIAGGDTYTIIYLKLQLISLKNNGTLLFENIEDTFCEELSLEIDEEAENIKFTLMFLQKYGLLEEVNSTEFLLPKTIESIGSEGQCAARVRKHREKKKTLLGNTSVTAFVTCNGEKEKDTDIEIDKDKHIECFETFWKMYPKKKSKIDAEKAWKKIKLTDDLFNNIMDGLNRAIKCVDWVKQGGQFIPNAATWLNGQRWNDEVEEAQTDLFTNRPKKTTNAIEDFFGGADGTENRGTSTRTTEESYDTETINVSFSVSED